MWNGSFSLITARGVPPVEENASHLIAIAAAVSAGHSSSETALPPPTVLFVKATRQTLSNVLSTNGKVEPVDYVDVRVESPGLVKQVLVHNGDSVRKDQVLAQLSEPGLQQELEGAIAREVSGTRRSANAPGRRQKFRYQPKSRAV